LIFAQDLVACPVGRHKSYVIYTVSQKQAGIKVVENYLSSELPLWPHQQEGQHPLTGQRTANFRLMAQPVS